MKFLVALVFAFFDRGKYEVANLYVKDQFSLIKYFCYPPMEILLRGRWLT